MGLLKSILNIGVTAGAAVAAVKVADKYKENNPGGTPDVNGDGKVDAKDVFSEVKRAAGQVYESAAATVREKGPAYAEKAEGFVEDVGEKAAGFAERAKDAVTDAVGGKKE